MLPEGFAWQNPDTFVGDVGTHTFYATYTPTDTEKYRVVTDIPIGVVVQKADVNLQGIYFNSMQCTQDGVEKGLFVEGELPQGIVRVEYENNRHINAGEYVVKAKFIVDNNHNNIADLEATLTIRASPIQGICFADKTVTYDGNPHKIEVQNLPEGAEVTYDIDNEYTASGTYPVTATVRNEYGDSITLSATLVINKYLLADLYADN